MNTDLYHPRAPLTDPGWFYGREQELRQLFSYLNKPSPQNVSIVGQRRIGKSWLLKVVQLDDERRQQYLQEPDKYTFIYWDLQTEHRLSPEMFLPRLADLILSHLPAELASECRDVSIEDPAEQIDEILFLLEVEGHRVILLIDEFAAVTRDTAFAERFFSHLRSLFSRSALTCVTSSFQSLGQMCHLGPDSPFFNIFARIQLRLMPDEEAEAFVSQPFAAAGMEMEPAAVKAILRLTGPHPCFISQLCYALETDPQVEPGQTITSDDVGRHNSTFRTHVFDDFTYYLNKLREIDETDPSEGEQAVAMLHNIAAGNPPDSLENRIYTRLRDLSLVRLSGGRPVPFSIAFSQHLKETKGTDVYFEQAFANPSLDGPNFLRLCEIALNAAEDLPQAMRDDLEAAIRTIQGRPQDAMRICGRDVLDPLLDRVHRAQAGSPWRGRQSEACEYFSGLADRKQFPRYLASSFHNLRIAGNDASHQAAYHEPCTPGRAFLTVLETIHVASEVYRRYEL